MWSYFILSPELFNVDETRLNPSGFHWMGWVKHQSEWGCAAHQPCPSEAALQAPTS